MKAQKRTNGSKYRNGNKKDTDSKSVLTNKDTVDNVGIIRVMRLLITSAIVYKLKPIVKKEAYQKKDRQY